MAGTNDAEAFDTDRCDIGAIFEYNYSHENDGGFLLTIQFSADTIVRYNISQNDGNSTDQGNPRSFLMNNTAGGLQVYDNDIFTNPNTELYPVGLIANSTLSYTNYPQPFFENNLVFNQNPAGVCYINTQPGANPWYVSNNDLVWVWESSSVPTASPSAAILTSRVRQREWAQRVPSRPIRSVRVARPSVRERGGRLSRAMAGTTSRGRRYQHRDRLMRELWKKGADIC